LLSTILGGQRAIEDSVGSAPLLSPVTAQLMTLTPMVIEARGPGRRGIVDVAAQWAQFAGWLCANTGAHDQARDWLDRAAEWSAESDNASLSANVLSYKGHLAWETRAVGPLIGLSQTAQRIQGSYPGQRAYDAGQEARGHAMAGDASAADRKLAEAAELWLRAADYPDGPPPWSYYYSPAFASLQRGIVQRLLGRDNACRARQAVDDLTAGLSGLPDDMRFAEWAADYHYHLAIAYIHADEPESACAATLDAAFIAHATESTRATSRVLRLRDRITRKWPMRATTVALTDQLRELTLSEPAD
jgi:tetratricopeptide (TPR) repeat protein